MNDKVMRWSCCPLQPAMCLQEKVEIIYGSNATVNNSTRSGVAAFVSIGSFGRVKACMMPFSSDALHKSGKVRT